jgi:hypothetical protein
MNLSCRMLITMPLTLHDAVPLMGTHAPFLAFCAPPCDHHILPSPRPAPLFYSWIYSYYTSFVPTAPRPPLPALSTLRRSSAQRRRALASRGGWRYPLVSHRSFADRAEMRSGGSVLPPAAVGIRDDDAAPLVAKLRSAHYEPQPPPFKIPTDPQPSVHDPYCAKQQLPPCPARFFGLRFSTNIFTGMEPQRPTFSAGSTPRTLPRVW